VMHSRGGDDGNGSDLPGLDTSVANPARVWNYWVGGKDNFAADREAAEKVVAVMPSMPLLAKAGRRFLVDAVHQLANEYQIRQFLDIGTGLPTAGNTHEIAQQVVPESRIVYVDNDPVVISHARALLTSSPQGKTDYLQADLRDPDAIVAGAAATLDLARPVGVLLIAVLHFIPDSDDPWRIVGRLMDAVSPGSALVIGHAARDVAAAAPAAAGQYNQRSAAPITLRDREQVTRFFDGLDLTGPGVVPLSRWWGSGSADTGTGSGLAGYCGIGIKP
jgi:hypothetical protein